MTLVANKLRAIVPFDTCVIYLVDDPSGKAIAAHVVGEEVEIFNRRRINIGDGITGWVIANSRSMCNASPDLDLVGIPEEIVKRFRGVLVSPLLREDGAFGAISLYSQSRTSYTTEHVRLLESVCQHASSALNNALTYEKTRESALVDPLTELPNARGFYMMLEQRLAECQRMNKEPLAVVCMDIDDFKIVNDQVRPLDRRSFAGECGGRCASRTEADGYSDSLRGRRICGDYADGLEQDGGLDQRANAKRGRRAVILGAYGHDGRVGCQPGRGLFPGRW